MHVLITGSAGKMGSTLVEGLKEEFELRGLDRVPTAGLADVVVGDIADFDVVLGAMRDIEAVIHLAAASGSASPWEDVLRDNIIGAYNVFEAARLSGVRRLALASRAGLLHAYPASVRRTVDMLPLPSNYYSISKVFGESLGYMYSACHGVEVVAVRIGSFRSDAEPRSYPQWLSGRDAVRVFRQAITHPGVKFEVVFGVSDSTWPLFDLDHGRRAIDYHPLDRSVVPEKERET